jgi:hypothetical protein
MGVDDKNFLASWTCNFDGLTHGLPLIHFGIAILILDSQTKTTAKRAGFKPAPTIQESSFAPFALPVAKFRIFFLCDACALCGYLPWSVVAQPR